MKKRKLKQLLAEQEAELREIKGLLITYNRYVMKCVHYNGFVVYLTGKPEQ